MAKFDKVIPPGQEGKIEMSVDGSRVHGEFVKTAAVHTNDPARRSLSIAIAGKEIPYVNVQPAETVFLHGGYGDPVQQTVMLTTNEKDLDFKVLGVTSNIDDKITYTCKPSGKPGEYALTIYKNPMLPTLTTYGMLFVKTNSQRADKTEIQVNVMTRGSISVSPITLNFGAVRFGDQAADGSPVTKSVILSKADGEFEVTGIDVSNANFHAEAEPVAGGRQYRVLVTFKPPMKRPGRNNESAELIIHTNEAREPAVRVQAVARAM
ncbi:MAG TPA: hypothetical protein VFX92_04625 [Candidatus Krumholzibacteria bacterium]|nr:hypothetical protein [Candidatus Krumholzibacteria bacterium]